MNTRNNCANQNGRVRPERVWIMLSILTATVLLTGVLSPTAFCQQKAKSASAPVKLEPQELQLRREWHLSMAQVPLPKKGCFQASYPNKEWHQVACVKAPNHPMLPIPPHGARPLIVGNDDDVSAGAPTSFISTAMGTFQSVTGVTGETSPVNNTGPSKPNTYTVQLNPNFFTSSVCATSPNSGCQGWQQFVFENQSSGNALAYIQYWLIQYGTTCPAGQSWNQIALYGSIYCWKNDSNGAVSLPNQPVTNTNLAQLSLAGSVSATGDSVSVSDGSSAQSISGDNAVGAASGWNVAEFNIFGDGGGGEASFNSGASITPKVQIIYGGKAPPNCIAQGFTGETNNLSFGSPAPTPAQPGPALAFLEDSAGGATSNCAAAHGIGDTHLQTFGGLFYDFQASGDFVLAQVGKDFAVHTRQVSGAPVWPNADVNSAVATRMGKTTVAVCLVPARLNVNGEDIQVSEDKPFTTPDGVDIWRRGDTYIITDASGNSVRAEVNPTWINVNVGLGHWPANVTGLLANAGDNVNQIATRDGTVLTNPFSFEDLYQRFGQSWRVAADDSLLSVCGQRNVENTNPSKPFYAKDLEPSVYEHARAVCTTAGIIGVTLLDACTLDVAVIGNDAAAKVFVGAPEPIAVAILPNPSSQWWAGYLKWLLLLLLIILILLIVRFLLKKKTP